LIANHTKEYRKMETYENHLSVYVASALGESDQYVDEKESMLGARMAATKLVDKIMTSDYWRPGQPIPVAVYWVHRDDLDEMTRQGAQVYTRGQPESVRWLTTAKVWL
jgi:hypothetical protein